jgi:CubicO group peptidase (beta-lactamase class C family)
LKEQALGASEWDGHGRLGAVLLRAMSLLALCAMCVGALAQAPAFDTALRERIDTFVETERKASGIPGVAVAIVTLDGPLHVRGFGGDGQGKPIGADTPFPIGSLTKSFTALLVRQAIDAGQLDADAPVQRYLPWFRVADAQASARITVRHLLNQTSGFTRAAGMAPLLQHSEASSGDIARGMATLTLDRAPGERFEYSNLNFILLGAVLEQVSGQRWDELVRERIFRPLGMSHSHTDHTLARQAGMTTLHRMWFGIPVGHEPWFAPGLAPTGSLVASATDMAAYLRMLLDAGAAPGARVVSPQAVQQLLAPATPPARSRLLSADFEFRYGEGWFVGPFGAAADARWHLGNLASFAAWMVLLPDTRQAVVVLINTNSELPFADVNAVMSRLPIGVVNLLRGQPPPRGTSLREAYRPFNIAVALAVVAAGVVAWRAARARRSLWAWSLALIAVALLHVLQLAGLGPAMLAAFAPDLALTGAALGALLCVPAAIRVAMRG